MRSLPQERNPFAQQIIAVLEATGHIEEPVCTYASRMPMALEPITGSRACDDAISRAYRAKWCAAHSPSAIRPGLISDRLRLGFADAGYRLGISEITTPGLIEVYPHPALVELCGEPKRLPYKVGKIRSSWPNLKPKQRRTFLAGAREAIGTVLEPYLHGAEAYCTAFGFGSNQLKAQEDMIDAIFCCVCAIRALEGAAPPYSGDDKSAIWLPMADPEIQSRTLPPKSPYSASAEMRREVFADRLMAGEDQELANIF